MNDLAPLPLAPPVGAATVRVVLATKPGTKASDLLPPRSELRNDRSRENFFLPLELPAFFDELSLSSVKYRNVPQLAPAPLRSDAMDSHAQLIVG